MKDIKLGVCSNGMVVVMKVMVVNVFEEEMVVIVDYLL